MRVVQINATCKSGSTGKICYAVSKMLSERYVENYLFYSMLDSPSFNTIKYSNSFLRFAQGLFEKVLGNSGFGCHVSSLVLLFRIYKLQPDIVHLHNIHSHDVNLTLLFGYLKKKKIKTFWTFHDCWAFTGGCTHYDGIGCNKWKECCGGCPIFKRHSLFVDRTKHNFKLKKALYGKGLDLTIITPSRWLGEEVKKSFLCNYPIKVINNGIDLSVFRPVESGFKKSNGIEGRFVILGVAFGWSEKKGLDVFIRLSKELDDRYQIVLVGTNNQIDKLLPPHIISIHRTSNQQELVEIYSSADVFLQLTREENFPTVNIEALACGTPIITFKTGGSPEIIDDTCGFVVEKNDYEGLVERIRYVYNNKPFTVEKCIDRAKQYGQTGKYIEYINLYKQ